MKTERITTKCDLDNFTYVNKASQTNITRQCDLTKPQNEQMKTKKDTLEKHRAESEWMMGYPELTYNAMDEYAKEVAIRFAEWCDDNEWTYHTNHQWAKWDGTIIYKTTSELYDIFLKNLNQKT